MTRRWTKSWAGFCGLAWAAVSAACGGGGSSGAGPVADASAPDVLEGSDAGQDAQGNPVDATTDAVTPVDARAEADAPVVKAPPSKLDILFVVDNARGMAQQQQELALVLPDLMTGLLNPACMDATGTPVPAAMQPGPTGACPTGTQRDFPPIYDAHVGVLSSSLGSFGADACPDSVTSACPGMQASTSNDDHGHLLTRTDPCSAGSVATYQSLGFLAWDPKGALNPPGIAQLGDDTTPGLVKSLHDIVVGDGQLGCGFESQNEAWYRFLVDPTPYQSISLVNDSVLTMGTDSSLLQQRQAFLRPDSLLVVIELTHKPDTSLRETSQYPLFAQLLQNGQNFHLPRARQECTTKGPTDPCCASCGQATPSGCAADPTCTTTPSYTDATENLALRAFGLTSHKARYGLEFFDQPSRYVAGLTSPMVADSQGNMVANPIYAGGQRTTGEVFYAAITGVPWQLVARQKNGVPDLVNGVSDLDPKAVGGFKSFAELSEKDGQGNTFWDDIAGNPEAYVAPLSPFMQEATAPRSGTDPITGVATSPASSPNGTNPINGHEWTIAAPPGDIEYACIFPALVPIDCSQPGAICDCTASSGAGNPLCDPNPNDSGNPTLQSRVKAYPGLKHLAIARGLGGQGIVASICAKQITDTTAADYAYRPAVKTIVDRLKPAIRGQ